MRKLTTCRTGGRTIRVCRLGHRSFRPGSKRRVRFHRDRIYRTANRLNRPAGGPSTIPSPPCARVDPVPVFPHRNPKILPPGQQIIIEHALFSTVQNSRRSIATLARENGQRQAAGLPERNARQLGDRPQEFTAGKMGRNHDYTRMFRLLLGWTLYKT